MDNIVELEELDDNNSIDIDIEIESRNNNNNNNNIKAEIFGWVGSISILSAYIITTYDYIDEDYIYIIDLLNIFGSVNVGSSLLINKIISLFMMELVWFTIASISLINHINN